MIGGGPLAIKIGDVVGNYQVIDLAGSGGMGAVYKIEHVITKRVEAMKLLPMGVGSDPEQVHRFEREIQLQARLHHPNIAGLYNAVRDGSSVAMIMEYVEGESLERMLEGGPLPLRTAVNYAGQMLEALSYAHHEGVVHRDVAPANIIITPDGTAKLTDFGLARTVSDPHLTTAGVAVGSAWYMSPEQVKALDELDERTDIYAMGAVLHEMLTGKKLYEADGSFAVMCAQVETVPQPPSASNPEVPAALDTVVAKALAKDPVARFQSAREFRNAMDAAVKSQLVAAPVLSLPAAKSAPPVPLIARLRPSRTTILFTLLPGAVAAVVCAVLLWPKPARVAAKAHVASPAVVSYTAPAPAPVIEPPNPPAVMTTPPAPTSAIPAVRPVRKAAAKPAPNLAIRVRGGTVEPPPRSTPTSTTPHIVAVSAPEAPAAKPETTAVPEAPPTPTVAAAKTPDEPAAAPPISEEAIPQKGGNRLVRALGKINPFRKNGKPEDTAKPATKKDN